MKEADSPLTNTQVQELLHLALRTYHDQAAMCHKAKAYLASCIMAGAVVEAVLTATTCYLYDEALKTGKGTHSVGKQKELPRSLWRHRRAG
jgi:hypothetical protein